MKVAHKNCKTMQLRFNLQVNCLPQDHSEPCRCDYPGNRRYCVSHPKLVEPEPDSEYPPISKWRHQQSQLQQWRDSWILCFHKGSSHFWMRKMIMLMGQRWKCFWIEEFQHSHCLISTLLSKNLEQFSARGWLKMGISVLGSKTKQIWLPRMTRLKAGRWKKYQIRLLTFWRWT